MEQQKKTTVLVSSIRDFIRLESAGGILLLVTAVLAMVVANSPLSGLYGQLLNTTIAVQVGTLLISKPFLLWVNDGLMAIFFFLIMKLQPCITSVDTQEIAVIWVPEHQIEITFQTWKFFSYPFWSKWAHVKTQNYLAGIAYYAIGKICIIQLKTPAASWNYGQADTSRS